MNGACITILLAASSFLGCKIEVLITAVTAALLPHIASAITSEREQLVTERVEHFSRALLLLCPASMHVRSQNPVIGPHTHFHDCNTIRSTSASSS